MKIANVELGDLVTYGDWYVGNYRLGLVVQCQRNRGWNGTGGSTFCFVWWHGPFEDEWEDSSELKIVSKKI